MTSTVKKLSLIAALAVPSLVLGIQQSWAETTGEEQPDYSFAYFVVPENNASFPEAPAFVDFEVAVYNGSEDAGITDVDLWLDNDLVATQACSQGCIFTAVEIDQGVHELRITTGAGQDTQDSRIVYVDEEMPSGTDETGGQEDTGDGDTGDGDTGDGDNLDSGGCQVVDQPGSPWTLLALPALLLIPGFGRTRRG